MERDLSLSEIDWGIYELFLSMVRSLWVPKMAFQMPVDRQSPSVAILDTVQDLEPYFTLIGKQGWNKHQVTLVFTGEPSAKKETLATIYFQRKLKKLGVVNVEGE